MIAAPKDTVTARTSGPKSAVKWAHAAPPATAVETARMPLDEERARCVSAVDARPRSSVPRSA